jgi:hypothetical protein
MNLTHAETNRKIAKLYLLETYKPYFSWFCLEALVGAERLALTVSAAP